MATTFTLIWGLASIAMMLGGGIGAYKLLTKMQNKLAALFFASLAVFVMLLGFNMMKILLQSGIFSLIPYELLY
jgi:uncharacterized membrane protein